MGPAGGAIAPRRCHCDLPAEQAAIGRLIGHAPFTASEAPNVPSGPTSLPPRWRRLATRQSAGADRLCPCAATKAARSSGLMLLITSIAASRLAPSPSCSTARRSSRRSMPRTSARRTIAPMPGSMDFFEFKIDLTQVSFIPAAKDAWRIAMPLKSRAARMSLRRLLMGSLQVL